MYSRLLKIPKGITVVRNVLNIGEASKTVTPFIIRLQNYHNDKKKDNYDRFRRYSNKCMLYSIAAGVVAYTSYRIWYVTLIKI